MHNRPELWQVAIYLLIASGLSAVASKVEMPDVWRLFVGIAAFVFWFIGGLLLIDWIAYESGRRVEQIGKARLAPATAMSQALQGHSSKAQDYIANQVLVEIQGIGGPLVVWNVLLPNGKKVPADLVWEFLDATEEQGDGYLFPIRHHSDSRFRDYRNVEESLKDLTGAFIIWGWADRPIGNRPAHLRVSVGMIRESMNLL